MGKLSLFIKRERVAGEGHPHKTLIYLLKNPLIRLRKPFRIS
jgi:hypothetical protein